MHVVVQSQKACCAWSKNYKGHRHFKYNDADDAMGCFIFPESFTRHHVHWIWLAWIEWIDARTLVGVGVSTVSRKVQVKVLFPGRVSQEVILILILILILIPLISHFLDALDQSDCSIEISRRSSKGYYGVEMAFVTMRTHTVIKALNVAAHKPLLDVYRPIECGWWTFCDSYLLWCGAVQEYLYSTIWELLFAL